MGDCDVTFCDNDAVFHVISKAVLPEDCAKELLQHESIGNEIYQEFLQARLQGKESIWSKIIKRRYKTFKTQLMMKKKLNVQVIQLREERPLLSWFLITSWKRYELDLEHSLSNFEFTVVPRSLFTSDGETPACKDKWKVLYNI